LKRLLGKSAYFDPKAIAILLEAYDGAVVELGLQTLAEKENAARIVLQLAAGQTDLDATRLRAGVAALMMQSDDTAARGIAVNAIE
jgi:hypothetical protein